MTPFTFWLPATATSGSRVVLSLSQVHWQPFGGLGRRRLGWYESRGDGTRNSKLKTRTLLRQRDILFIHSISQTVLGQSLVLQPVPYRQHKHSDEQANILKYTENNINRSKLHVHNSNYNEIIIEGNMNFVHSYRAIQKHLFRSHRRPLI